MTRKEQRQAVYQKCNGKCAYCGTELPFEKMQIDHVKPVVRDFEYNSDKHRYQANGVLLRPENDHIDNMLPSCRSCNLWKHSFDLETFRFDVEHQIKRLNQYSANYKLAKRFGLIVETQRPIVFYFEQQLKEGE